MLTLKQNKQLVQLALTNIGLWLVTTFAVMILWHVKGGLAMPTTPAVSLPVYQSAVEFSRILIFRVIPALTCGYLLVGLLLLRFLGSAKKEDRDA
jgi:hypothetical protein